MESTRKLVPSHESATETYGELVVQNGKLSGARRALNPGITTVGSDKSCTVRLKVSGVSPYHCSIVCTDSAVLIRDLGSETGTVLNGEHVVADCLHDGDLLTVGSTRFRVRLSRQLVPPDISARGMGTALYDPSAIHQEREALRIQAAAVAAQQAGLIEEEGQLEQKKIALQKQEEQISAHLNERQAQTQALQEQVSTARADLRKEREETERGIEQLNKELEEARRELQITREKTEKRRDRVGRLQRRLRRRYKHFVAIERSRTREMEQQLAEGNRTLASEREALKNQSALLQQERLAWEVKRLESEQELDRAKNALRAAQNASQHEGALVRSELQERSLELDRRQLELENFKQDLLNEEARWNRSRLLLQKEADGLEQRVINLRRKLLEARPETPGESPVIQPIPAAQKLTLPPDLASKFEAQMVELEKFAGDLADQRTLLVEEFAKVLRIQEQWSEERRETLEEVETLTRSLEARENDIEEWERTLEPEKQALRQKQEELNLLQHRLSAWETRLNVRDRTWEKESDHIVRQHEEREERTAKQQEALAKLREHWLAARKEDSDKLSAEFAKAAEAQQQYASLRQECLQKMKVLQQSQRSVAEQTLVLEQFRQECLGLSKNEAVAERKLEQYRRRYEASTTSAIRQLEKEHQRAAEDAERLRAGITELGALRFHLMEKEDSLLALQTAFDLDRQKREYDETQLRSDLQNLQQLLAIREKQIQELSADMERIATSFLKSDETNEDAAVPDQSKQAKAA